MDKNFIGAGELSFGNCPKCKSRLHTPYECWKCGYKLETSGFEPEGSEK